MRTGQGEFRFGVVECRRLPGGGVVAGVAVRAELPFMCIFFGVACVASSTEGDKLLIEMALGAINSQVGTGQRELRFRMVEGSRDPAVSGVAAAAVRAQLRQVGIVFGMARITVLWGRFEITDAARLGVAAGAADLDVLPAKLEGDRLVIEIMPIRIDPIVAGQAVRPEHLSVAVHEISFNLLVARAAHRLVESCITIHVACTAGERRAVRLFLVGGQHEAERVVRAVDHRGLDQGTIHTAVIGVAGAA